MGHRVALTKRQRHGGVLYHQVGGHGYVVPLPVDEASVDLGRVKLCEFRRAVLSQLQECSARPAQPSGSSSIHGMGFPFKDTTGGLQVLRNPEGGSVRYGPEHPLSGMRFLGSRSSSVERSSILRPLGRSECSYLSTDPHHQSEHQSRVEVPQDEVDPDSPGVAAAGVVSGSAVICSSRSRWR